MASISRRNAALANKIAQLQQSLMPILRLPSGPVHPSFPRTLLNFYLLTEDELDSMAHFYHQATPGFWTDRYDLNMNWDKNILARPPHVNGIDSAAATAAATGLPHRTSGANDANEADSSSNDGHNWQLWLDELMTRVGNMQMQTTQPQTEADEADTTARPDILYAPFTNQERITIKRRKVGKFIGLRGMDTPIEETFAFRVLRTQRTRQHDDDDMVGWGETA